MEQRRLRLGDILDDYCPRERRLTNHVVVAMIEEDVKQTRCSTCDAEHPYKGGKVPRRRKQETPTALYKEVLAGMPDTKGAPLLAAGHLAPEPAPILEASEVLAAAVEPLVPNVAATLFAEAHAHGAVIEQALRADAAGVGALAQVAVDLDVEGERQPEVEEGPVHRQLIRAQLPRIEGHKEERRLPEFTIRQATRANGHFRGADSRMRQPRPGGQPGNGGNGNGNSSRSHGGPRFAGSRPGAPGRGAQQQGRGGPAAGFRGGQPRPGGGGKKRSR
jgi:hypothetical protein